MTRYDTAVQKRKSISIAVIAAILLFAASLSFLLMLRDSLRHKEALDTTQRYMTFESEASQLIHSNVALLKGFDAYIKANADFDGESVDHYLDYLFSWDDGYIRNIGVLKDTTIIWNYPREINEGTIGVDLAKVESQRELVLKVKETQAAVFQGPFDLIQSGTAFSVRLPIVREDTGYWGQISIILKADRLLEEIGSYARRADLDLAIFSQEDRSTPFFGRVDDSKQHLIFDMDPSFINWQTCVNLTDGWLGNPLPLMAAIALLAAFSAAVGIFVLRYLDTNYKILNISAHDHLTGLYNRRFLNEYQAIVLGTAKRRNCRAGILMVDIDRFKKINDTYGHETGDRVLVETARILREFTREDEATFRLGGDEFLMLFPEVGSGQDFQSLKERLNQCFEQEFKLSGHSIQVALSFGYALFPDDGQDFDTLLSEADKRLYREKAER